MTVWVVLKHTHYEGYDTPVGVFESETLAKAFSDDNSDKLWRDQSWRIHSYVVNEVYE